jgi:membrane-associated protein
MIAGIFSWVTELSDWLSDVSSNWWFLAVIFTIAYLDSVIPIVPSETCVIIGGVSAGLAGAERPYPLIAVIVCGAIGAFLGDNTAYTLGRKLGPWFERRAARKPKTAAKMEWAKTQIQERGGLLLITGRFIPGGRTVLTLSSGITAQPRKWFMSWIAIASVIWATYASLLGFIGGKTFEDNHTKAFLVAFGLALSVTVLIEVVRHFLKKKDKPSLDSLVDR